MSGAWKWSRRLLLALLAVLVLLVAAGLLLDTSIGKRFLVDQLAGFETQSGLRFKVGRIDGSIYGQSRIKDLRVYDPKQQIFGAVEVKLDWRPLAWLNNTLDIRSAVIERGAVLAVPKLRPTDSDAPLLPDFDIVIGRLEARNLVIAKGIAGDRRIAQLTGRADIRSGRALVDLNAVVDKGDDRVFVKLDARPDANRLALDMDIEAPKDGVIAALAGMNRSLSARLSGKGTWAQWQGVLSATSDADRLAAVSIAARSGRVQLDGNIWPAPFLVGVAAQLTAGGVMLDGEGTLDERVLDGSLRLASKAVLFDGKGAVDLGNNSVEALALSANLRDPNALGTGIRADQLRGRVTLDGAFDDLDIDYLASASRLDIAGQLLERPRVFGIANWSGDSASIPLEFTSAAITTENDMANGLLGNLGGKGELRFAKGRWTSDGLDIRSKGLRAVLNLGGDGGKAGYLVTGSLDVPSLALVNLGTASLATKLRATLGGTAPWQVSGSLTGGLANVKNDALNNIAGGNIRFASNFSAAQNAPVLLSAARLTAPKVSASGSGRREADGRLVLSAAGRHSEYGPFNLTADGKTDGLSAVLLLDSPLPSLGLANVRLALAPIADGFGIKAEGGSSLGPFTGDAGIFAASAGRTLIRINQLNVSQTRIKGDIYSSNAGIAGDLAINGGGLNGTATIASAGSGQRIIAKIIAANARFDGATPLMVAQGNLDITAFLQKGRSDIDATIAAQGISSGNLFLGKLAANAKLVDGAGTVTASLAGRRGSRFDLQTISQFSPNRVSLKATGNFARRQISTPNPVVLTRTSTGWQLAASKVNFGRGSVIASGYFGGGSTSGKLQMSAMPLSLIDIAIANLGLGGNASGTVEFVQKSGAAPTGTAKLKLAGLTRSGLVLTSRPIDVAMNAAMTGQALAVRAVGVADGKTIGRMQAQLAGLPASGAMLDRLRAGRLFAQLRYNGPADALWRLTGVEGFDFTGDVQMAADARGSIRNPQVQGAVQSQNMRLDSPVSGTVLTNIVSRGRFNGSVLNLTSFSGKAPNGGTVVGSGTIDLGGAQGISMDLRAQATNALILNRDDFAATVTGPLAVKSTGSAGGVLSGNLAINSGRFQLGQATAASQLPNIKYREVNVRADTLPARVAPSTWTYDITAKGANRLTVTGLGLDSEWGADILLTGSVNSPRISGRADLVRGEYQFAGRDFDLEKGRITFRNETPINPVLDIVANADVSGLSATINVAGTGLKPEITFASVPALPEEEVLSRLVFGSSVTDISAPEAVQLAASLAALRSGGGLDPINKLRGAIGLDRLRIVGADAATGQGTSISAGKYITRQVFVEVITDGRGYSATQAEFQITKWLSILSSISTLGRESANVRVSKDY